jgi:hypothetical protein
MTRAPPFSAITAERDMWQRIQIRHAERRVQCQRRPPRTTLDRSRTRCRLFAQRRGTRKRRICPHRGQCAGNSRLRYGSRIPTIRNPLAQSTKPGSPRRGDLGRRDCRRFDCRLGHRFRGRLKGHQVNGRTERAEDANYGKSRWKLTVSQKMGENTARQMPFRLENERKCGAIRAMSRVGGQETR